MNVDAYREVPFADTNTRNRLIVPIKDAQIMAPRINPAVRRRNLIVACGVTLVGYVMKASSHMLMCLAVVGWSCLLCVSFFRSHKEHEGSC